MTAGMRLRSHLIALVLAMLVPMVVFAAIVVVMFGRQQRATAERGAVETARALMNAVDEALGSTVTTLEALATARSLAHGDLREFHAEARRVLATRSEEHTSELQSPCNLVCRLLLEKKKKKKKKVKNKKKKKKKKKQK